MLADGGRVDLPWIFVGPTCSPPTPPRTSPPRSGASAGGPGLTPCWYLAPPLDRSVFVTTHLRPVPFHCRSPLPPASLPPVPQPPPPPPAAHLGDLSGRVSDPFKVYRPEEESCAIVKKARRRPRPKGVDDPGALGTNMLGSVGPQRTPRAPSVRLAGERHPQQADPREVRQRPPRAKWGGGPPRILFALAGPGAAAKAHPTGPPQPWAFSEGGGRQ